jgi:hypothetical protein
MPRLQLVFTIEIAAPMAIAIDRVEYSQRKIEAEHELKRWEAMTIDAQRQLAELLMKMEVVNKLGRFFDSSSVED